jgi:hypothetical protein
MTTQPDSDRYKLVEESSGTGTLVVDQDEIPIAYAVKRFQGMTLAGLPVPGAHRIDGEIRLESGMVPERLVGRDCRLSLADGRTLRVTLVDAQGRILAEGHGPSRCLCC